MPREAVKTDISNGSMVYTGLNYVVKSANYTLAADDDIVGVNTSGGAVIITLPSGEAEEGRPLLLAI